MAGDRLDQDLHHLSLEDCRSYYRNHYHPGNMTVVIAGYVDPERVRDLVGQYFGAIPTPGVPRRAPSPSRPSGASAGPWSRRSPRWRPCWRATTPWAWTTRTSIP